MDNLCKLSVYAAAAAIALTSCAKDSGIPDTNEADGNTVTIRFDATSSVETRATLTPEENESLFKAAWAENDAMTLKYGVGSESGSVTAEWKGTSFEASGLPDIRGDWTYEAYYPALSSKGTVAFGPARTQTGAAYNSAYDVMTGTVTANGAAAGKTADGSPIVVPMQRQTAIAYFHLTSDSNEAVTKASLKIEGGKIAAESVVLTSEGIATAADLDEIVLTLNGQTAGDFTLWFNLLPASYTSMLLTVETESGKTVTLSKSKSGSYEAGKLYKVVRNIVWEGTIPPETGVSDWIQSSVGGSVVVKEYVPIDRADWAVTGKYEELREDPNWHGGVVQALFSNIVDGNPATFFESDWDGGNSIDRPVILVIDTRKLQSFARVGIMLRDAPNYQDDYTYTMEFYTSEDDRSWWNFDHQAAWTVIGGDKSQWHHDEWKSDTNWESQENWTMIGSATMSSLHYPQVECFDLDSSVQGRYFIVKVTGINESRNVVELSELYLYQSNWQTVE